MTDHLDAGDRVPSPLTTTSSSASSSSRARRIAAIGMALTVPLALAGCFNGPNATTTTQASMNSGNGAQTQVGAMKVENATLVRNEAGAATLIMSLVNVGEKEDAVRSITIGGTPAVVTDGSAPLTDIVVPAQGALSFGTGEMGAEPTRWANTYTTELPYSGYVPVSVLFADAGQADLNVLVVPPVGYYEGIAPNPAADPATSAAPTPSGSASAPATPAASASASPSAS